MRGQELLGRGTRRLFVGGVAALALLGMSSLTAGSAVAAPAPSPTPIQLSKDGVLWSPSLPGGLFDQFQGIIPDTSVSTSFYVQNPTASSVTMTTRAVNVTSSSTDLDNSITVDGTAGGVSLAKPVLFGSLTNCSTVAPDLVIPANGVAEVTIDMALLDVSGTTAQGAHGGFDLLLTMQDDSAGLPPTSCDSTAPNGGTTPTNPTGTTGKTGTTTTTSTHHHVTPTSTGPITYLLGGNGALAFTGVAGQATLYFAGALVALGILLLVARRRRKKSEQES